MVMPTDQITHNHPPLPRRAVLEADDQHSVPLHAFPPAAGAVLGGDTPRGDEFRVARFANVVVAVAACWAVEARCGRWDRVGADVAGGGEGEGRVVLEPASSIRRAPDSVCGGWWEEGGEGVAR